jgi:hypothetical protein
VNLVLVLGINLQILILFLEEAFYYEKI